MTQPSKYPGLDAEFSEYLRSRGVPPDVAAERGYRTVRQGKAGGGGDFAAAHGFPAKAAGMLIPLHGMLDSDPSDSVQLRIAKAVEAEFTNAKGVRKFITPQRQRNVLATHPRTRTHFGANKGGIVCEGVTRVDALAAFGIPAVGITGVWNWRNAEGLLPDLENLPIKGGTWILAPDGDVRLKADVFDAVRRLKSVIEKKGAGAVHVVALPAGMGLDDWIASNDFQDADKLLHALYEHLTQLAAPAVVPEIDESAHRTNDHYRILGLENELVAVWISAGQVLRRSREAMTSKPTLIALAPLDWWETLTGGEPVGQAAAARIGDSLLREADSLGQVDTSRITGRGAFALRDDTVGFHLGDRLLIDGKETAITDLGSKNGTDVATGDRYWLAQPRIELGEPATDEELARFATAVMAYRWAGKEKNDGRRFLGWMVAGLVGGALPWRPHVAFTAPAGEGKTWILENVYERVMLEGQLFHMFSNVTEAALARLAARGTVPMIIDEAEAGAEWVMRLLETIRVAAGGTGKRARADGTSDGVTIQSPKFSVMLSSTSLPRLAKADASRLATIRLGDEVENWPAVKANIEGVVRELAPRIRSRIIIDVAKIVTSVKALIAEYEGLSMNARDAHISAALTAGWRFWTLDARDVHATDIEDEKDEAPDVVRCVRAILERSFRLDGGHERSASWVLATEGDTAQKLLADRLGIRRYPHKEIDSLCIWHTSIGLQAALRDTEWRRSDLRPLLLEIPGAFTTGGVRYGSQGPQRSVVIPVESLRDLGIDMDQTDLPDQPAAEQQRWG